MAVLSTVLFVHCPALSSQALSFDDKAYLTDNYLVQNPGWGAAERFLKEVRAPTTVPGYYQPLTMISLMLDCAMGGSSRNLRPFHATSLAFHVSNTALVILLCYLLLGNVWAAMMVGLVFGVHPMTVEPIPWIGERKTVLATFFALCALVSYVQYARAGQKRWYVGGMLAFVLALMSKPTTTPLPVLLLLLDYWPLGRLNRRAVIEKIPFFAIAVASAIVTYVSQKTTGGVYNPSQDSAWRVPMILCHNIVFYPWKMFRPVHLSSHYPFPEPMDLSHPHVLAGIIGTVLLLPVLWLSLRRTRALITGWLFFFIAILPTMGIIGFTNVIASDKYVYLPSVGLLLCFASLLTVLWNGSARTTAGTGKNPVCAAEGYGENSHDRGRLGSLVRQRILICAAVLLVASMESIATRRYLFHWRDSIALTDYMLQLAPNAASLHFNKGVALAEAKRTHEATAEFVEAIRLRPQQSEPYDYLGHILAEAGRFEEAIHYYEQGLNANPADIATRNNLAIALAELGRTREAAQHCMLILQVRPTDHKARNNLANTLAREGHFEQAIDQYRLALQINPFSATAHNNLGFALSQVGQSDQAMSHYQEALRLFPRLAEAHRNLAKAHWDRGQAEEGIRHYTTSLQIRPDDAQSHVDLGNLFAERGRVDEGIAEYREALRINPAYPEAHNNLASVLAGRGDLDEAAAHYSEALRLRPDFADALVNLGNVLAEMNRVDEADQYYRRALRINPNLEMAHNGLGNLLERRSRFDEASHHYQEALRLNPQDTMSRTALNRIIARQASGPS